MDINSQLDRFEQSDKYIYTYRYELSKVDRYE